MSQQRRPVDDRSPAPPPAGLPRHTVRNPPHPYGDFTREQGGYWFEWTPFTPAVIAWRNAQRYLSRAQQRLLDARELKGFVIRELKPDYDAYMEKVEVLAQDVGKAAREAEHIAKALEVANVSYANVHERTTSSTAWTFFAALAVVKGAITGQLTDDSLSIAWDGVEQIDLPITIFIDGAGGTSEEIAREVVATETPWPKSAVVSGEDAAVQAESITQDRSEDGDVVIASATTWRARPASAERPGGSAGGPPPVPPPDDRNVRFDLPSRSEAEDQLAALTVEPEGSMLGYDRDDFNHWIVDEESCSTRQVVLQLDADHVTLGPDSCEPITGSWFSPYDFVVLRSASKEVAIDHVVPLGEAWRSGADDWTDQEREDFANDIDAPQLLSISRSVNSSKQDRDPAVWKPPAQGFDCDYARMWVNVKFVYHLSLQQAEKDTLDGMLTSCPAS